MDEFLKNLYETTEEEVMKKKENLMVGGGHPGPCLVQGNGIRVQDIRGKSYIDCTSQSWALYLGHCNREIQQTVYEHMGHVGHIHQGFDTITRATLANKLASIAPKHLNRVSFTVGGGPAIEAAMKIAVKNVPHARHFISLKDAYHGCTLTAAAASWTTTRASGNYTGFNNFLSVLNDVFIRVPNPYLYHWTDSDNPEDCIDYCLKVLEDTLSSGVSGPVAGIVIEPIQASAGQIPMPKRYLQGLRDLCDKYGCLLIFDEIQTYCRIGEFFAAEHYQVEPDIIVLGKALGAGFPIAAIIIHDRLIGFDMNAEELHTFANNSVSQVAALKQIQIIEREGILENVKKVGKHLSDGLHVLQQKYPQIGDIRQVGLHIGVEMVEDPETKVPLEAAGKIKAVAMEKGLILGNAGFRKNILKVKPPLITTQKEADEILAILDDTFRDVIK